MYKVITVTERKLVDWWDSDDSAPGADVGSDAGDAEEEGDEEEDDDDHDDDDDDDEEEAEAEEEEEEGDARKDGSAGVRIAGTNKTLTPSPDAAAQSTGSPTREENTLPLHQNQQPCHDPLRTHPRQLQQQQEHQHRPNPNHLQPLAVPVQGLVLERVMGLERVVLLELVALPGAPMAPHQPLHGRHPQRAP